MRTKEELYEHLLPDLQQLERHRRDAFAKGYRSVFIAMGVGAGVGLIGLIIGYFNSGNLLWPIPLASIPVGLIIGFIIRHSILQKFKLIYKSQVVSAVVSNINPGLYYDAELEITRQEFRNSQLFSAYPHRYNGEDLIQGRYKKTDFRLSEIHAEERRQRKTKNGTQTYYVTIFKGLFLIADFHKDFKGRAFVYTDHAEKTFGSWLSKKMQYFSGGRGDLVYLEDPEFERYFKVYSDDQVEARYILSTSMMQDILALRKKFKTHIQLAFLHSNVYLAISTSIDFLEPDIKKNLTEPETLYDLYTDVQLLLQLIDDLNLNTRIWSKQGS